MEGREQDPSGGSRNEQGPDPSRSAAAAAARWGLEHPDEDVEHAPPSAPAESDEIVPNRHSASAEAASLRWQERHRESN
jgi:hypothetical protein